MRRVNRPYVTAALKDPARYNGVVNGVAPEPTTMGGLCEAVAEALDRPNWLPVPGFALKAGSSLTLNSF